MKLITLDVVSLFLVGLHLVACSASQSVHQDATDSAADVGAEIDTGELPDSANETVDTELSDSLADAEGQVDIGASDGDSEVTADVPTAEDGAPCWGLEYPQLGCPCDPSHGYRPCCIKIAYGLVCDAFFKEWSAFQDCGCDTNPSCGPEPTYALCAVPPPQPEE